MPLLKIGGWVSTKIRKSKTQKTSYHLHHATISRFRQPPPHIPILSTPTISTSIHIYHPKTTPPILSTPTHHFNIPYPLFQSPNQPNPTISPTPFLTNHPSQITLLFHPTHHQYSPHPYPKSTPNPLQISSTYYLKTPILTP